MLNETLRRVEDTTVDFKTVFEGIPGCFIILQPDAPVYTILAASDQSLQLFDRKRQNIIGQSVFEVFPENTDAITAAPFIST